MRTNTVSRAVETSVDLHKRHKRVKFRQTAEAFELYSKMLYKHPWPSVIREYANNGADAHVRRGDGYESVPIVVRLPTPDDPVIRFRDFGVSMTYEQVVNFFDYNASDKRDEDGSTGSMGIGAKAAYAVAEQFSLTTYSGAYKQIYLAMKDAEGFPLGPAVEPERIPCDEEQGVEIAIPVNTEDTDVFTVSLHVKNILSIFAHYGSPYKARPIVLRDEFKYDKSRTNIDYKDREHAIYWADPENPNRYPAITTSEEDQKKYYLPDPNFLCFTNPTDTGRYFQKIGHKLYRQRFAIVAEDGVTNTIAHNDLNLDVPGDEKLELLKDICRTARDDDSRIVLGGVKLAYADMIGPVVFHGVNASTLYSTSSHRLYLGNIAYKIELSIDNLRARLAADAEARGVSASEYGSFVTAFSRNIRILLHNTNEDGTPHNILWQPSREGLVEGATTKYIEDIVVKSLKDLLFDITDYFSDMVDGDIHNIRYAVPALSRLYPWTTGMACELGKRAVIDLWPFEFAPDLDVDVAVPGSWCNVDTVGSGDYRLTARDGDMKAYHLHVNRAFDFVPKKILILAGAMYVDRSIREQTEDWPDSEIRVVRCMVSELDEVQRILKTELGIPEENIRVGIKVNANSRSRPRIKGSVASLPAEDIYKYDCTGYSVKSSYEEQVTKGWDSHSQRNIDGIIAADHKQWLDKNALVYKSQAASVPMTDKTIYLGVGFYKYYASHTRTPRICGNEKDAKMLLRPSVISPLLQRLNNLMSRLYGVDVKLIGIKSPASAAWNYVTEDLLGFCNRVLVNNTEIVRRSLLHYDMVHDDQWRQVPNAANIWTYIATNPDVFARTSILRKFLRKLLKTESDTNGFKAGLHLDVYSDVTSFVQALDLHMNDVHSLRDPQRSRLEAEYTQALTGTRKPLYAWSSEDTRDIAKTLVESYPAIDRIAMRDAQSYGSCDESVPEEVIRYIRCVDAARPKEEWRWHGLNQEASS